MAAKSESVGIARRAATLLLLVAALFAFPPAFAAPAKAPAAPIENSYALGSGDKVRVIVFGEEDLSGEFVVDDTGFVSLPLIGQIAATGRTVRQLEQDIAAKLGAQYLKDPRVSIEVLGYRPFYIIGEVNKPGEYPFVAGMSVLNAVAMAGGYSTRANESSVYIKRKAAAEEEKFPADATTKLEPGDIVNVVERWF
ncbi:MAG: polysaccharide export protein [Alphaproteobacteria bacterium]|nr:polysaccharide export protein [Alphaproteobacteria bacterium]